MIPAALAAAATYAALVRDETAAGRQVQTVTPRPASGASPGPSSQAVHIEPEAPIAPLPPPPPRTAQAVLAPPDVDPPSPATPDLTSPSVYDLLAGAPSVDPQTSFGERPPDVADSAPANEVGSDPWQVPLDEGRFALGGWAASAGHSMVSAVTFRRRLPEDIAPDRIVLEVDASDNVSEDGLVVLADPGFAPDREGFTLLLAAADPGPFSAAGSYRVLPTGAAEPGL